MKVLYFLIIGNIVMLVISLCYIILCRFLIKEIMHITMEEIKKKS